MQLLDTIKSACLHPRAFFEKLSETGLITAWKFYAIIALIAAVLSAIVSLAMGSALTSLLGSVIPLLASSGLLVGAAIGFVLQLILIFVGAAILHVFVYLLGGRSGYGKTFQAYAYGMTPGVLLSWIPLVSFIGMLWSLYTTTMGVSALHKLSTGRAFLAIILPIIVAAVIAFAVAAAFIAPFLAFA